MDPEAVGRLVQVGIDEIQDNKLELVQSQKTIDSGAQPQGILGKSESAQHRLSGRLQQQASSGRLGLGEAFEDRDAVSGVGKKCRGRLAGDPASDDADF
jgi:hypothetical protein